MTIKYVWIIAQELCALTIFVFCFMSLRLNHLGQNIINLTAASILAIRFENILAFYRLYLNSPFLESPVTFVMLSLLSLGYLIERNNPTLPNPYSPFNKFCLFFLLVTLCVNLLYYLLALLTLILYIGRQLYKLATGNILSSSATLLEEELQLIRRSYKPYQQLTQEHPLMNTECSICLCGFQTEQLCIVLPGCEHCFHSQCIDQWLVNKSSCPYCRSNIRLGLMRIND